MTLIQKLKIVHEDPNITIENPENISARVRVLSSERRDHQSSWRNPLWCTRLSHHYFCTVAKLAAEFFFFWPPTLVKEKLKCRCNTWLEVSKHFELFYSYILLKVLYNTEMGTLNLHLLHWWMDDYQRGVSLIRSWCSIQSQIIQLEEIHVSPTSSRVSCMLLQGNLFD